MKLISVKSIEIVYFENIVAKIESFKTLYSIACSIV